MWLVNIRRWGITCAFSNFNMSATPTSRITIWNIWDSGLRKHEDSARARAHIHTYTHTHTHTHTLTHTHNYLQSTCRHRCSWSAPVITHAQTQPTHATTAVNQHRWNCGYICTHTRAHTQMDDRCWSTAVICVNVCCVRACVITGADRVRVYLHTHTHTPTDIYRWSIAPFNKNIHTLAHTRTDIPKICTHVRTHTNGHS